MQACGADLRLMVEGGVQNSSSCRMPSPYRRGAAQPALSATRAEAAFSRAYRSSMRSSGTAPQAQEHTAATVYVAAPRPRAAGAGTRAAVHQRRRVSRPG
jgi:hypothetical protein